MSEMPWHWPSFLAGWFAGREDELGTGVALGSEQLARETEQARQEWEQAKKEAFDV